MKKEYICPDVEYISLIAEEKVTSGDGMEGDMGVATNPIFPC